MYASTFLSTSVNRISSGCPVKSLKLNLWKFIILLTFLSSPIAKKRALSNVGHLQVKLPEIFHPVSESMFPRIMWNLPK